MAAARILTLSTLLLAWGLLVACPAARAGDIGLDAYEGLGNDAKDAGDEKDDGKVGIVDVFTRLNVRSGPGIEYGIIGKLYPGQAVKIVGERNGWYRIQYRGGTAWICGFYVWTKGKGTRNADIRGAIRQRFGDIPLSNRGSSLWPGESRKAGGSPTSAGGEPPVTSTGSRQGKRRSDGGLDLPLYNQGSVGADYPSGFCGPTSLKMVLEYYGKKYHVNQLSGLHGGPTVYVRGQGSTHAGLLNMLRYRGLRGSYMTHGKSLQWLKQQTDAGYPVVVSVTGNYAPGRSTGGHIITVVGFTNDGRVILNDSAGGVRRYAPANMFLRSWHGGSGGGMAIVAKP